MITLLTLMTQEMTPEQQAAKLKELGKTELTVEEKRKHGFIMTLVCCQDCSRQPR